MNKQGVDISYVRNKRATERLACTIWQIFSSVSHILLLFDSSKDM